MHRERYSPNLERRYQATVSEPETLTTKWPRACSGAANAFLVLLGPSMGAANRDEQVEHGGAGRPITSSMTIGPDVINFDGLGHRKRRWNRLCAEMLGGEHYISSTVALLNLDWSHHPSESAIPQEHLTSGFTEYVWPLLTQLRPRIICPLTRRVWDTIMPEIYQRRVSFPDCPISLPRAPIFLRLPDCAFVTMLIKPHNHPSRALSYEQISVIGQACTWFQNQPA